jgi:hypothetical protein
MLVVRQRKIFNHHKTNAFLKALLSLALLSKLISCNPTELSASGTRSGLAGNTDGSLTNKSYVYLDNPVIYSGPNISPVNVNMANYLDPTARTITTNSQLVGDCTMNFFFYSNYTVSLPSCFKTFENKDSTTPISRNSDLSWNFVTGTAEFYEVNTQFHVQQGINKFFSKLEYAYNQLQTLSITVPRSVPSYLKDSKMFWFKGVTNLDSQTFRNSFLSVYALCNLDRNAYFSPAGVELCFGYDSTHAGFYVAQDPTIIYHELGHALVSIMMNLRNGTSTTTHDFRSNLGALGYDEAQSINEGIADYYSFVMNGRTHLGEWLGRATNLSRPMSEDDPIHIAALDTTSEGRLSYPAYVLYDANTPDSPVEEVHVGGQIMSHYLVALTKSLQTTCNMTSNTDGGHDQATSYVMMMLAETLSEIGDLNAKGIDDFGAPYSASFFFNNLDSTNSFMWTHFVNQTTYRRISQIMAKNIYKYISGNLCPAFGKNESEKLLDDYGLLLFKTYNNNGNSTKDRTLSYTNAVYYIPTQALTTVSEDNRRKSVLVSKQLIDLASTVATTNVGFYILDGKTDIDNVLANLLYKGFPVPLSTSVTSTTYNNSNLKLSPGEVVGLIPNLYNSSNTTMAGVQLLATDWDHVTITDTATGNFKPCVIDTTTTVDQGAVAATTGDCATTDTNYSRLVKKTSTGLFPSSAAAPICLVQLSDSTSTRWVSQNEFRKKQGLALQDKDCLGYSSSGTVSTDFSFNPHECLARFLPGASDAFFSKIDPQSDYYNSVVKKTSAKTFNTGNLLLMEVNKWIPPGTKFRCRMRARFNNCSDCYTDASYSNDDYQDSELNGAKPFKVINFDFEVND